MLSSVILCNKTNHFLIWLWHAMKSGFYIETTSSVDGSRKISKALPKVKLAPKRVMVTGGLLLVWSTTAFRILEKRLHLRSMFSRSIRYTKSCTQFFCMTIPDHTLHNQSFKSWMNWATKFCLICHIHLTSWQLTKTVSNILITFCMENASTTSRRQMMPSKIWSNSKA